MLRFSPTATGKYGHFVPQLGGTGTSGISATFIRPLGNFPIGDNTPGTQIKDRLAPEKPTDSATATTRVFAPSQPFHHHRWKDKQDVRTVGWMGKRRRGEPVQVAGEEARIFQI